MRPKLDQHAQEILQMQQNIQETWIEYEKLEREEVSHYKKLVDSVQKYPSPFIPLISGWFSFICADTIKTYIQPCSQSIRVSIFLPVQIVYNKNNSSHPSLLFPNMAIYILRHWWCSTFSLWTLFQELTKSILIFVLMG